MNTTPIGDLSNGAAREIRSSTPSALEEKGIPAYIVRLLGQLEREKDPGEVRYIQGGLKVLRELQNIRSELKKNMLTND